MYITIGSIVGWILSLGLPTLLILRWKVFSANVDKEMAEVGVDYWGDRENWLAKAWDIMRGNVRQKSPSNKKDISERAAHAFVLILIVLVIMFIIKILSYILWPALIIFAFAYWIVKSGKVDGEQTEES